MKVNNNIGVISICIPVSLFALCVRYGIMWFIIVWIIGILCMIHNRNALQDFYDRREKTRKTIGPTSYGNEWANWNNRKQELWSEYQRNLSRYKNYAIEEVDWKIYYSKWKSRWKMLMDQEPNK